MKTHEDMNLETMDASSILRNLESKELSEYTSCDILLASYVKNRTAIGGSKLLKAELLESFDAMITNDSHITWNNVRTLLFVLHLEDTDVDLINRANACVRKIHEHYAEEIPQDICEWFRDI